MKTLFEGFCSYHFPELSSVELGWVGSQESPAPTAGVGPFTGHSLSGQFLFVAPKGGLISNWAEILSLSFLLTQRRKVITLRFFWDPSWVGPLELSKAQGIELVVFCFSSGTAANSPSGCPSLYPKPHEAPEKHGEVWRKHTREGRNYKHSSMSML